MRPGRGVDSNVSTREGEGVRLGRNAAPAKPTSAVLHSFTLVTLCRLSSRYFFDLQPGGVGVCGRGSVRGRAGAGADGRAREAEGLGLRTSVAKAFRRKLITPPHSVLCPPRAPQDMVRALERVYSLALWKASGGALAGQGRLQQQAQEKNVGRGAGITAPPCARPLLTAPLPLPLQTIAKTLTAVFAVYGIIQLAVIIASIVSRPWATLVRVTAGKAAQRGVRCSCRCQ